MKIELPFEFCYMFLGKIETTVIVDEIDCKNIRETAKYKVFTHRYDVFTDEPIGLDKQIDAISIIEAENKHILDNIEEFVKKNI